MNKIVSALGKFSLLLPGMPGFEAFERDVVLKLTPEAVLRPHTKMELLEIVKICQKEKIPYTATACRTSVTGASVSDRGILISLEKLNRVLTRPEPHRYGMSVQAEAGIMLKDFQKAVEDKGYFYPPDPTSWEEIQLGGSVATNATGENSYHYGSSRNYILGLEYIDKNGNLVWLERNLNPLNLPKQKNLAGYSLELEPLDLLIGSEGTLGIITEIKALLLPKPNAFLSLMLFVKNETEALRLAQRLDQHKQSLHLICLEYMDEPATQFIKKRSSRFFVPQGCSSLYIKTETPEGKTVEEFEDEFLQLVCELYSQSISMSPELIDHSILAKDYLELLEFRRMRHHVPATINEISVVNQKTGGGKVSSDWWVPIEHLVEHFAWMREEIKKLNLPSAIFGHIGNGHPHVNIMPKTAEEKQASIEFTKKCMLRAASLGGGVCGEHGLGKIKTWALPLQWDQVSIDKMKSVKAEWDPEGLAAPGNIFV
ncbi:MAG: FAD-binding oxidoreductase [Candidatus Cloacimonetes bacterium]|nr:FAD-binding oxidoreductase [Candidatus Cloacimonadota bacterium]